MPEDINLNNSNSEINLNLKIPQEDAENAFSFKNLVLTIYNARKTFLIWICIGLVLGIASGGLVCVFSSGSEPEPVAAPAPAAEVSALLTLFFDNPSVSVIADFYTPGIWDSALKTINRSDIAVADAMAHMSIINISHKKSIDELSYILSNLPGNIPVNVYPAVAEHILANSSKSSYGENTFRLIIPPEGNIFTGTEEKESFLRAFCDEYKKYVNEQPANGNSGITVIYTAPSVSAAAPGDEIDANDSTGGFPVIATMGLALIVCLILGIIMAFIITAVRKYIPENE